jgi:hypothetical protein
MRAVILTVLVLLPQAGAGGGFADRLVGVWTGTGTVLNQPASVRLEWAWALDRQFLKLTFGNDMGPAGQQRRFEGHAYYQAVGNGRLRGTWFDSSGAIRPIDARIDGDALVSRWGTADTEEGETTYRLLGHGTMEVVDRVKGKDGAGGISGRPRSLVADMRACMARRGQAFASEAADPPVSVRRDVTV